MSTVLQYLIFLTKQNELPITFTCLYTFLEFFINELLIILLSCLKSLYGSMSLLCIKGLRVWILWVALFVQLSFIT